MEYKQNAEHQQIKDKIQQSEEFFRLISGYCPVGIFVTNQEGDCVYLNSECQSICGFNVAESLGKSWINFIHPEEQDLIFTQWYTSLHSGFEFKRELRFQTPLGITKRVYVRSRPIPNNQGYVNSVEDISDLVNSNYTQLLPSQALETGTHQPQEQILKTILSTCVDHIFIFNRTGRYQYVSESAAAALGLKPEDFVGKTWQELNLPAQTMAGLDAQFQSVIATGRSIQDENEYVVADSKHYYEYILSPLFNQNRDIEGAIAICRNVTERKQAEEALRLSEERFRVTLKSVPLMLAHLDCDLRFTWVANTPPEFPPEAVLGRRDEEIFPAEVAAPFISFKRGVLESGVGKHTEFWIDVGNQRRAYDTTLEPLRDTTGRIVGLTEVALDITERKLAQKALQESEQRLQLAQRAAKVGAWEWNLLTGKVSWSEGIWDLLDITLNSTEPSFELWLEFMHPGDRERVLASAEAVIAQGEEYNEEFRIVRQDGTVRWLSSKGRVIRNADGQAEQFLGVNIDITERKQFEEERARRVQEFETLAQNLPDVIARFDRQLRHIYISPVIEKFTGIPAEAFIGKTNQELGFSEEHSSLWSEKVSQVFTTGEETKFEFSFATPNGIRFYEAREIPEFGTDGQVESVLSIVRDVTEYKRIEQALRESEEQYRTLVMASSQIVWKANPQGFFIEVQGWEEFTGQPVEELIVQRRKDCIHPEDLERVTQTWWQAIRTKSAYKVEHRIRKYDSTYEHFAVHGVPMFDGGGQVKGWVGMTTNINGRKQAEEQRDRLLEQEQAARQRAEEANRIKDEFLAVLSHELRTPLNPILGWASLLRSGRLDAAKTAKALETIERNAKLQIQLIDDLLDVSRILRGKLCLNVAPIDLAATIEAAKETVRLAAEAKGVCLQMGLDNYDKLVVGDAGRLQQVVWNLLTNAVKFTAAGGTVEVKLKYIDCHAHIIVKDTGKGISPDFLPYVFDYFRQADSTTTRTFGGLGLGLAIVRHLVELHGGTVQAASAGIGQGATFTVRLPLLTAEGKNQHAEAENDINPFLNGVKVLVVEDQTDTRDLIAYILEQHGAVVTPVASAVEALHTLMELKPDILLSDIGMPNMDGYTLIRQIRTLSSEQGGGIPAIALTAYVGEIDQQRALRSGFQRHLCKPVEPTELISAIASLISQ